MQANRTSALRIQPGRLFFTCQGSVSRLAGGGGFQRMGMDVSMDGLMYLYVVLMLLQLPLRWIHTRWLCCYPSPPFTPFYPLQRAGGDGPVRTYIPCLLCYGIPVCVCMCVAWPKPRRRMKTPCSCRFSLRSFGPWDCLSPLSRPQRRFMAAVIVRHAQACHGVQFPLVPVPVPVGERRMGGKGRKGGIHYQWGGGVFECGATITATHTHTHTQAVQVAYSTTSELWGLGIWTNDGNLSSD